MFRDLLSAEGAEFPERAAEGRGSEASMHLAHTLVARGRGIGAIVLRRTGVGPFSDKQIDLLQTFADQAVIAIENVGCLTRCRPRRAI